MVDIRETDEDYQIDLEVPAVQPSDVKVTFKDGVLAVTGERKYEKETKGKVHRVEHHYGRFTRSFRLPENVDEGRIEANAKDGVLYLKVPKRPEVQPRAIEVNVQVRTAALPCPDRRPTIRASFCPLETHSLTACVSFRAFAFLSFSRL